MKMKKLNIYILALCSVLAASCEKKFLDKAPGVDVTENTIFSSQVQLETYVASLYRHGLHHNFPTEDRSLTNAASYDMSAGATDEGEYAVGWLTSQRWNSANITASDIVNLEDYRFYLRWTAIRMANIIMERINEVPNTTQEYRDQIYGEAKFVRALNYFEMIKRYGGVPIADKRFLLTDSFNLPRSSLKDCVDMVVADATDAAAKLPPTYPSQMRGRATRGAALLLKARMLLYAASPLFNTATPYLDFGDKNNLICYTNYDKNRWKLAADAAKDAITWIEAGNAKLIDDKGVDQNYKYMWTVNDNSEIILAWKGIPIRYPWELPWAVMKPNVIRFGGWGGLWVTFNFVRKYEKKDGTPQTWPGGSNLPAKYNELDPRFKQTVAYHNSYWNVEDPKLNCVNGSIGHWMHKQIPYELNNGAGHVPNYTLFRAAEAYLDYAEALNEFESAPPVAAYDAVNLIRRRSGMPNLPTGLTTAQFRERIQRERDIELAFEDHRFWDIRRWMVAEQDGVMQGDMWGLRLSQPDPGNDAVVNYTPYVFEQRTFLRRMYLHPFILSEVNKGYLAQNPGW